MSIREYVHNSKSCFDVYINIRSIKNPNIRIQKRKKKILTESKARAIERALTEKAIKEIIQKENLEMSWGKLVLKWYEYKKTDNFEPIAVETLGDYLSALKTWTKDFWDRPYTSLSRGEIKNIIVKLDDEGRSKSFQSKIKHNINSVFKWAIENGEAKEITESPTVGIRVSRKLEKEPKILTLIEIKKLIEFSNLDKSPWYPIWLTALLTGCRNGELYALTWDCVDFNNRLIRVTKSFNKRTRKTKPTKGGYWRTVPMNQDLFNLFTELKSHENGPSILPRPRDWRQGNQAKALRLFCITIGISPVTFHTLRACFATQLLQHGVSIATVMKICGWKNLDTMTKYIRLSGIEETGATNILQLLSPNEAVSKIGEIFRI